MYSEQNPGSLHLPGITKNHRLVPCAPFRTVLFKHFMAGWRGALWSPSKPQPKNAMILPNALFQVCSSPSTGEASALCMAGQDRLIQPQATSRGRARADPGADPGAEAAAVSIRTGAGGGGGVGVIKTKLSPRGRISKIERELKN